MGFQPIKKTEAAIDQQMGKAKQKAAKTKNEYFRELLTVAILKDLIKCRWILADIWYSSNDNMEYIKFELHKDFILPIRSNRLVALSESEKHHRLSSIDYLRNSIHQLQSVLNFLMFPSAG